MPLYTSIMIGNQNEQLKKNASTPHSRIGRTKPHLRIEISRTLSRFLLPLPAPAPQLAFPTSPLPTASVCPGAVAATATIAVTTCVSLANIVLHITIIGAITGVTAIAIVATLPLVFAEVTAVSPFAGQHAICGVFKGRVPRCA